MRASISVLLILILCLPCVGGIRNVDKRYAREHDSMHWIVTMNDQEAAGCTATAIGPHALLTAEHCDFKDVGEDGSPRDGSPVRFFVDVDEPAYKTSTTPYIIAGKIFDHSDHMILLVSGPEFKRFVQYDTGSPAPGEEIAWFGNPGGVRDQFREGYVMGRLQEPAPFQTVPQPMWLVDAASIPGDSGSLVFDEKNERIVGIVTYGIDNKFMGMFELHFSPDQVLVAQLYDGRAL